VISDLRSNDIRRGGKATADPGGRRLRNSTPRHRSEPAEGVTVDSFARKLAVVTGGGSGMGRALVIQLAAQGCSVAACDGR